MERRYETRQAFANDAEKEKARADLANRNFAQLKQAGLVPAGTKLDSPLPADVQKRVNGDPELAAQKPKNYGELMKSLISDGDKNGKLDFDAFQMNRVLPNASQQQILNALNKDTPAEEIKKTLTASGATDAAATSAADGKKLKLDAPTAFGLKGENGIDEAQQQLLLRTGVIFADSNKNGKLDADDKVQFLDRDGAIKDSTFGKLPPDLQKTVKLNVATAEAARAYSDRPLTWAVNSNGTNVVGPDGKRRVAERVNFPHYIREKGETEPEAVNKDFWSIGTADVNGRTQTSWKLNDGKTPAEAVDDVVGGKNSFKYTTECAQMRDVMRMKGLRDYYSNEYGKDEGAFRFNAQFPKDAGEKAKADAYVQKLDDFKKANPGKSFADFQKTTDGKDPGIKYGMSISRHDVLSGTGAVMEPWKTAPGESAAGDAGYFHNHSVSVEGVRIGYVGENVLDVGFKKDAKTGEVERQFWGHPGGIKGEKAWQDELGTDAIKAKTGTEYEQYFSREDIERNMGKKIDAQTKRIDEALAKTSPAPTAEQKEKLEQDKAFLAGAKTTFAAVTSNVDDKKLEDVKKFLASNKTEKPADMKPLADSLDWLGKKRAVAAFGQLSPKTQGELAKQFGKGVGDLSEDEKAQGSLFATLTDGNQLTKTGENLIATSVVNTGAASFLKAGNDKVAPPTPPGPLHSRDDFNKWLGTPEFKKFYQDKTGKEWKGGSKVDDLSQDDVKKIVELALPQTATMLTTYSDVNGGNQLVSSQLAALLKDGKLPEAEYRSEGTAIPRS